MSGYLLDTNIVFAFINDNLSQLPGRIRELLSQPGLAPFVSTVSPWEISIKALAGKLQLRERRADIPEILRSANCALLPVTLDHALEVARPEPMTKDPFDRLLLAVCACEGLKLVTTDRQLQGHRLVY
jgi:PIN domain nuclease of toxin-antitoxin system